MYTKSIQFNNNEIPAKINTETGEVLPITNRPNNIPLNKERFVPDAKFSKNYTASWTYLLNNLSAIELKIALKMSTMTENSTNSLSPLDDSTTVRELADFFGIGINSVKKSFDNLFKHGVYASFKYYHHQRGNVEEWVFNPFISFKGRLIDSDIKKLFLNTKVTKAFLEL